MSANSPDYVTLGYNWRISAITAALGLSQIQKLDKIIKMRKKNADYTGATDDPFRNFRYVEELQICSVEAGMLARMSDKVQRLTTYMEIGEFKVKDEGPIDTSCDLANYSVLLIGFLTSTYPERL